MSEKDIENFEKKEKMMDLFFEVYEPEFKFFDIDSDKMIDEKIEVFQALKDGKSIADIPNYYDILELMPKDDMWD